MAFQSVERFLHSSQQNVPILYTGLLPIPLKLLLPVKDLDPI